jgi:predicted nucleotidyltransferase
MSDNAPELTTALTAVVHALRQGLGQDLVAVTLFGSRARGEAGPESDWDLLIIAHNLPQKPLERHFRLKALLPEGWRARVALLAKTPAEFEARLPALYLDIALDGIVLYDSEGYITPRLAYVRELLARLGLRRERTNGDLIWCWQKSPPPAWALEWEERL